MQFDLFDAGANTILGAESYGEFKERLRDSGCDKCALHVGRTNIVVDRGSISKLHCLIVKTDGLLFIRDLGSTNGTKVNAGNASRRLGFRN